MRQLLCYAVAAAMVILACTASAAQKKSTYKKKSAAMAGRTPSVHKSAPGRKGTVSRKAGSSKKGTVRKATTWRNRQLTPSPERYKEIQSALVAKGYMNPEDASGTWNQASIDGLKKFQAAQNLDSSGKINSLSLIALGLGPKRESPAVKPVESPQ